MGQIETFNWSRAKTALIAWEKRIRKNPFTYENGLRLMDGEWTQSERQTITVTSHVAQSGSLGSYLHYILFTTLCWPYLWLFGLNSGGRAPSAIELASFVSWHASASALGDQLSAEWTRPFGRHLHTFLNGLWPYDLQKIICTEFRWRRAATQLCHRRIRLCSTTRVSNV